MKLWQVIEAMDPGPPAWTWRVVGPPPGGAESTSARYPNYGAAVTDAIKHGFQPSRDHWIVVTPAGVTRFEPSAMPVKRPGADGAQPVRPSIDGKGTGV